MSINNYSALTQSQTKTPALYYAQGRNKDGSLNLIEKVAKTDDKYESTNLSTRKSILTPVLTITACSIMIIA